jgi:hypothetical protein
MPLYGMYILIVRGIYSVYGHRLLVYCRKYLFIQKEFCFGYAYGIRSNTSIMPHLVSKEARLRFVEVNIFLIKVSYSVPRSDRF